MHETAKGYTHQPSDILNAGNERKDDHDTYKAVARGADYVAV